MANIKVYHTLNKRLKVRNTNDGIDLWPLYVVVHVNEKSTVFRSYVSELFSWQIQVLFWSKKIRPELLLNEFDRTAQKASDIFQQYKRTLLLDSTDASKSKLIEENSKKDFQMFLNKEKQLIKDALLFLDPKRKDFHFNQLNELIPYLMKSFRELIFDIQKRDLFEVLQNEYKISNFHQVINENLHYYEYKKFLKNLFKNHKEELNRILPNKYFALDAYLGGIESSIQTKISKHDRNVIQRKMLSEPELKPFEIIYYHHLLGDFDDKIKADVKGNLQEVIILNQYSELTNETDSVIMKIKNSSA